MHTLEVIQRAILKFVASARDAAEWERIDRLERAAHENFIDVDTAYDGKFGDEEIDRYINLLLQEGPFAGVISVAGRIELCHSLLSFLHDRLKVHLREQGIRHDVIDACLAMPGSDDLTLLVMRARALDEFLKTDDGENLVQGFRRANNLWRQAMENEGFSDDGSFRKAIKILDTAEREDGVEYSFGPDPRLAEGPEEAALFAALDAAEMAIGPAMAAEDFAAAMRAMAALRGPIDAFFEAVQINTENQVIRRNRLNLLHRIREICRSVADLSRLEG